MRRFGPGGEGGTASSRRSGTDRQKTLQGRVPALRGISDHEVEERGLAGKAQSVQASRRLPADFMDVRGDARKVNIESWGLLLFTWSVSLTYIVYSVCF